MDYMQGNANNNQGLNGLGVINTNNSSATIDNTTLNNFTEDDKLISTNASRFTTDVDWCNYLYDYMSKSPVLNTRYADDVVKQSLGISSIFYTEFNASQGSIDGNTCFCILACPSLTDVQNIIKLLSNSDITNLPSRRVAIGYFNEDSNTKNMAKQAGLELMGYDEILDVNNAVNNGINKIPYMNIGSNTFATMLAKKLNEYYKQNSTASIGQGFGTQMSGIGAGLGAAFSEGFGQLKDSLLGFGKQLGIGGKQGQVVNVNQNQQSHDVQPQEVQPQEVQPQVQEPIVTEPAPQFEQPNNVQVMTQAEHNELHADTNQPLGQTNENMNLDMSVNSPSLTLDKQEHNLEMNTTQPLDLQAHHKPSGVNLGK